MDADTADQPIGMLHEVLAKVRLEFQSNAFNVNFLDTSAAAKSSGSNASPQSPTDRHAKPYRINIVKRRSSTTMDYLKQKSSSTMAIAEDEVDAGSISKASPTSMENVDESNASTPDKDGSIQTIELDGAHDEVDRQMKEAEDSLSSAIWYAPLIDGTSSSHAKSNAIPVPVTCNETVATTYGSGSYVYIGSGEMSLMSESSVSDMGRSVSDATTPEIIPSDGDDWDVTPGKEAAYSTVEVNDGFITIRVGQSRVIFLAFVPSIVDDAD